MIQELYEVNTDTWIYYDEGTVEVQDESIDNIDIALCYIPGLNMR